MIDMDWIRAVRPPADSDPFYSTLGLQNLQALWPNFADCGARWLLIADVVERPEERAQYERAIPGGKAIIVRLNVKMRNVHARLRRREPDSSLDWYLARANELQRQMTERRVADIVIDVDNQNPDDVALRTLHALAANRILDCKTSPSGEVLPPINLERR